METLHYGWSWQVWDEDVYPGPTWQFWMKCCPRCWGGPLTGNPDYTWEFCFTCYDNYIGDPDPIANIGSA